MIRVLALMLLMVFSAVIAGCKDVETKCATTPLLIKTTEVRYVPVDTKLTARIPDPGPALVPGLVVGGALQSAARRGNALERANQRLACIAAIQGREANAVGSMNCGLEDPTLPVPDVPPPP